MEERAIFYTEAKASRYATETRQRRKEQTQASD